MLKIWLANIVKNIHTRDKRSRFFAQKPPRKALGACPRGYLRVKMLKTDLCADKAVHALLLYARQEQGTPSEDIFDGDEDAESLRQCI